MILQNTFNLKSIYEKTLVFNKIKETLSKIWKLINNVGKSFIVFLEQHLTIDSSKNILRENIFIKNISNTNILKCTQNLRNSSLMPTKKN